VDALIDVGGAMAGSTNQDVAKKMVSALKTFGRSPHKGVVYFNNEKEAWYVCDVRGNLDVALHSSSLTDAECFVYFDESRCRGADKKLKRDARALVTLEPKLTKDKFLQGCARMRRLHPDGQKLVLAGTSEVVSSASTVKSVLEMIVHNTVLVVRKALPTYLDHGRNFASFPKPIDIPVSLEYMYRGAVCRTKDFCEYLNAQQEMETEEEQQYTEIIKYCKAIGDGLIVQTGGLGEECERELEEEEEEENEQEVEMVQKDPFKQVQWNFLGSLVGSNHAPLFGSVFHSVQSVVRDTLPDLEEIQWSSKLYCTGNFWKTIMDSNSCRDMSLYLRPVNSMLVFRDGSVVLISLFDLENLLPHWWKARESGTSCCSSILQLSRVLKPGQPSFAFETYEISVEVLTSIKLFCGMVDYSDEDKQVMSKMFATVSKPRSVVETWLMKRQHLPHFDRSDLEEFCDSIITEKINRRRE